MICSTLQFNLIMTISMESSGMIAQSETTDETDNEGNIPL